MQIMTLSVKHLIHLTSFQLTAGYIMKTGAPEGDQFGEKD